MSTPIDLPKINKQILLAACKSLGLSQYSKMNKDDLWALIIATKPVDSLEVLNELASTPAVEKKAKAKSQVKTKKEIDATPKVASTAKPRVEKMNKKLERSIVPETYKEQLIKFTEATSDAELYSFLEKDILAFIKSDTITASDYKKYVDEKHLMTVFVEYIATKPDAKLVGLSEDDIYKKLAVFMYKKDVLVYEVAIKKVRKYIIALHKPLKEVNTKKEAAPKKVKKSSADDVEEEEEEDNDDVKSNKDETLPAHIDSDDD